jgi:hypothetical protein
MASCQSTSREEGASSGLAKKFDLAPHNLALAGFELVFTIGSAASNAMNTMVDRLNVAMRNMRQIDWCGQFRELCEGTGESPQVTSDVKTNRRFGKNRNSKSSGPMR